MGALRLIKKQQDNEENVLLDWPVPQGRELPYGGGANL